MNKSPNKVFVWPMSTRIIHWMLAITFTTAFITSFYEDMLHNHIALGFIFGIMIVYRIIWGFIGPRYARFSTFKLNLSQLKFYFVEKIQDRWRAIPAGHNPASSWFTIWAMIMGSIIVTSGMLLYGIQEAKGILSFLNDRYYNNMDIIMLVHQIASYIFLFWVFLHISGVMIEQFYHKTNMVFAMITGFKRAKGDDTEVSKKLNFFAYSIIVIAIGTYTFITSSNYNFLTSQKFTSIDYKAQNPIFVEKCGDCHNIYPPFLLPKKSWSRVMGGLDNHFGEEITEANITKSQQITIKKFLYANSADTSTRESSVKIMKSLGKRAPKAITKTPYWRETHKDIPLNVFKTKKIKDKSNCIACHKNFDDGMLDDMDITYRD